MESKYYLMDGRATFDPNAATVLETCDTLTEALNGIDLYGNDTCIVRADTMEVVSAFAIWQRYDGGDGWGAWTPTRYRNLTEVESVDRLETLKAIEADDRQSYPGTAVEYLVREAQ